MNLLVTTDENYLPYLNVMLFSLKEKNPDEDISLYVLHTDISESLMSGTKRILGENGTLTMIKANEQALSDAPTTSRYPKEMYYRIFAAKYLPEEIDRVLYLDPDVYVNGSLSELYNMDMGDNFYAAASHTDSAVMHKVNKLRLDMDDESPYINSGVMLMNLERLRKEQNTDEVFEYIEKRKKLLILPDQDIISSLYGSRIIQLDSFKYNMTERMLLLKAPFEKELNVDWVRENSVIIHYCGRNKPWKNGYVGQLDVFYREAVRKLLIK